MNPPLPRSCEGGQTGRSHRHNGGKGPGRTIPEPEDLPGQRQHDDLPRGRSWTTKVLALTLALFGAAVAMVAAEERLPEVVVTAPAEPEGTRARDPTAFATVVDTTSAPTRVETLADALGDTVGVQVRRFGGLGDFSTVSIRGFSSGQVQVYLDGVPLGRADNETVNLADLPLDAVDHVEVYRSVTPLAFAQAGPGGVVNIVTRRPGAEPFAAASTSFGSFTTRKVDVTRSATVGAWDYLAFAHYFGSAGDFDFVDQGGLQTHPEQARERERQNNAFNLGDLTGRVGWHPAAGVDLALTTDTFAKDGGVPGHPPVDSLDTHLRTLRQIGHLDAVLTPLTSLPLEARANAWVLYNRDDFTNPANEPPLGPSSDQRSTAGGTQVLVHGAVGAHQLPGLLVAVSDEQVATRVPSGIPDRTRLRLTVAGEDELLFFADRLSIVPALRWEWLHDDFPGAAGAPGVAPQPGGTETNDYLSPRLGVRVDAGHGLSLLGNASRAVRPPNLFELFGNRGSVKGNRNLRPEKAITWDIGGRFVLPALSIPLSGVVLEYSYFDSHVDDLIQLVLNSQLIAEPQNVGAARLRGNELSARARLWDRLGLAMNYTHQSTRDEGEGDRTYKGNQLPGRPADELYARLAVDWSPARPLPIGAVGARLWPGELFFDVNFIAGDYLARSNDPRFFISSRLLLGAGCQLSLPWAGWQAGVEGRNLTDDQTSDVLGFPLPGRSWFVTLSYGFGADTRTRD